MTGRKNDERVHMIVSGRVQAVGFRFFTLQTAREFHIVGWVRNRDDGTVEISASGSGPNLDAFIHAVRKGNRFSRVQKLDVTPEKSPVVYESFEIVE
ncbi:acylphosphatase [Sporolactobacillus vineae]|uniref:acylphosphatase n=1 Tax=Sporolactobacillus vineae TaxID=444463 RepID=UPI00028A172A|nr:acylphosphatase [Sporolactobacillus vineae]